MPYANRIRKKLDKRLGLYLTRDQVMFCVMKQLQGRHLDDAIQTLVKYIPLMRRHYRTKRKDLLDMKHLLNECLAKRRQHAKAAA